MPATLRLGASLKYLITGKDEYLVDSGKSVRDTLLQVGIKPELIALVSVNGAMQTKDYVIQEDDIIRIMSVVGGG